MNERENEGKGKRERNTSNNEKGRMGFFKCVSVLIICKSTSPERERDGCYGCAQAEIETRHQT